MFWFVLGRLEEAHLAPTFHKSGHDCFVQLLDLLHSTVPASALGEAGGNVYKLISGTVGGTQLCLPVSEAHTKPGTIHLLEALLHDDVFVHETRTAIKLVHEGVDTLHNMIYGLLTDPLDLGTQLRCVHKNRHKESLDIHILPPYSAVHFACFSACYRTRAAWNYAISDRASTNYQWVPCSMT